MPEDWAGPVSALDCYVYVRELSVWDVGEAAGALQEMADNSRTGLHTILGEYGRAGPGLGLFPVRESVVFCADV